MKATTSTMGGLLLRHDVLVNDTLELGLQVGEPADRPENRESQNKCRTDCEEGGQRHGRGPPAQASPDHSLDDNDTYA